MCCATLLLSAFIPTATAIGQGEPVQIQVDLDASIGPFRPIYSWFGYDEANYTTMPHGRQLLRELHDLSQTVEYHYRKNL